MTDKGEMTELVPDESPVGDSDGKKGADGTTAHQRIRGKTCDEQEERLTQAKEPRKPPWLIGKHVYMVDEIGSENLVPNTAA